MENDNPLWWSDMMRKRVKQDMQLKYCWFMLWVFLVIGFLHVAHESWQCKAVAVEELMAGDYGDPVRE